jgi:hypothetical protein
MHESQSLRFEKGSLKKAYYSSYQSKRKSLKALIPSHRLAHFYLDLPRNIGLNWLLRCLSFIFPCQPFLPALGQEKFEHERREFPSGLGRNNAE